MRRGDVSSRIGEVLGYVPGTVEAPPTLTVDLGGGDIAEVDWFGGDAPPLVGDTVILAATTRSGELVAIGATDGQATSAMPGERRTYARSPDGAAISEIIQRVDGSIELNNAAGSIVLGADGSVAINGLVIDVAGNLTTTGSVSASAVSGALAGLDTHVHTSGAPGSPTTPPTPGS